MHLHELMGWPGPMTHLEFRAWAEWELMEENRPTRRDFLIMRVAQRVQQVLSKKPNKIKLEDQDVRLVVTKKKRRKAKGPLTKEQALRMQKARWLFAAGMDPDQHLKPVGDGTGTPDHQSDR